MSGIMMSMFMYVPSSGTGNNIIWVANTPWVSGTGSITANANPAGATANDIMVLCIETANNGASGIPGIPTTGQTALTNNGWARVANSNTSLLSPTVAASQNTLLDIWWQRRGGAQTNPVIGDAGDHTQCVTLLIRGAIETGDPWDGAINVTQTTASAQVTSGNITTSAANTLILTVIASPRDAAAAHINASPLVLLNGSGDDTELTRRANWGATAGNGGTIGTLTHRKPTAGATANVRANTVTSNVAIIWTGALKPKT